jgi:signal transduction histidine kinase
MAVTVGHENRNAVPSGALSLEWKLPLLMTGGIAAGLAVLLICTYTVLRDRADTMVRDRLKHAVGQIAVEVQGALADRAAQMQPAVRDAAVRRLLGDVRRGGATKADVEAADAALRRLLPSADSLHPAELWDASGGRVLLLGGDIADSLHPSPRVRLRGVAGDSRDAVQFSEAIRLGDHALFWAVAPVTFGGTVAGYVAQARVISGQRAALTRMREFLRDEVTLYSRNSNGSLWVAAPGTPASAPDRRELTQRGAFDYRDGRREFVAEAPVKRTPWSLVIAESEASVYAPLYSTMRMLAALSAIVVAVGALISWFIGRRIARPLIELTDAVELVSAGTYEHRVAGGRDEIGRLAASFDAMALQVALARRELEQRAAEAEEARAEAEAANRSKSDFLATMSHELRTPLNAIGGYTQLMQMGIHGPVTDAQQTALSRIERSQSHLLTLISDLLGFARIDAGRVEYDIQDVPLHEALASVESLMLPLLHGRRVMFMHRACGVDVAVRADRDKLAQIVLNLLGNAIKYTPDGGEIWLSCDGDEQRVRVNVADTGRGIPEDRLDRIFEPFVQGERALNRPNEGVGLGLAISRELAGGIGAELTVRSIVGRGSTFTLSLRRASGAGVVSPPVAERNYSGAERT